MGWNRYSRGGVSLSGLANPTDGRLTRGDEKKVGIPCVSQCWGSEKEKFLEQFDLAVLVVRLWVGLVMILHGLNHGRNLEGTARWFGSVGFRNARINALVSSVGEVAIGTAIAAGFLTSFGAAGMGAMMFVAFWSIHRFAGFFVFHRPDEGFEYVATLAVVGFALAVIGPGSWSVDGVLGIADDLDGPVGALIFAMGLVVGYVQTLVMWKRPIVESQT